LSAELQSKDGESLSRDGAVVRDGSFFFDFDLQNLSEFSSYKVIVVFDPEDAPFGVRRQTGFWGEALQGDGVRVLSNRRIYTDEIDVLLSPSAAGREWEGRNFADMETSERVRLTGDLERYLQQQPDDKVAKLALARAYLAGDPKEYAEGSRAHQLLLDAARTTRDDRNGSLAREILQEIEDREQKKKLEQRVAKATTGAGRFKSNFSIVPGQSLGAFRLGSPYRTAARYFQLDRPADFRAASGDQTVVLKDFNNLELTYGNSSRSLISARTTSPKFRLAEGYGVGSLLQEFQAAYGSDVVYTPEYAPAGTGSDGKRLSRGTVVTDGLEIEVQKEVDATFGIPVEKVIALRVFEAER
jgi:hypothetical protein